MPPLDRDTPILILDDSPAIRARVEAYLRRLGFTNVSQAGGKEEALEKFRAEGSRIVFLDLVLDEERGADFAAEALAERPFTNIVVMTALPPSHEFVTAAIAEGAREFLPKPIQFHAIQAVLDHLDQSLREEEQLFRDDASYM